MTVFLLFIGKISKHIQSSLQTVSAARLQINIYYIEKDNKGKVGTNFQQLVSLVPIGLSYNSSNIINFNSSYYSHTWIAFFQSHVELVDGNQEVQSLPHTLPIPESDGTILVDHLCQNAIR